MAPSGLIVTATNLGASDGVAASLLGRSRRSEEVISGAAIMKMTSSTSMTSISGVMLISPIGLGRSVRSRRPKAMSGFRVQHLAQVVCEAFQLGLAGADLLAV